MAWCGSADSSAAVHWFNPENDIALARNDAAFTPPKAACELRRSGSVLPLWYGSASDFVLGEAPEDMWTDQMHEAFGIDGRRVVSVAPPVCLRPQPWGWSDYARAFFMKCGFPPDALPSASLTAKMRELSHRRTAALISRRLIDALPGLRLAPPAVECSSLQEVRSFLASHPDAYLKSPWSSSGRGVLRTSSVGEDAVIRFAAGSIRHQGSVMAEQAYDRVGDFAMLFECSAGKVVRLGTSVFVTRAAGVYSGNLLASEERRFGIAAAHAGVDNLYRVSECLVGILQEVVAPHYQGVLGVDMLVDSSGLLDAAVELNLRTTMGYVANRFYERFMLPGACGVFRVGGFSEGCSGRFHADDGKLVDGCLRLNPGGRFAFVVSVSGGDSRPLSSLGPF